MEKNTSIERRLIPIYFKRFDTLNKGLLRLLAITSGLPAVLFLGSSVFIIPYEILHGFRDAVDGIAVAIVTVVAYCIFWLFVRLVVWIVDGFKEKTNG